jgi:hypothetical protein
MTRKPTSRSHGEGSIYRSDDTRAGSGVSVERWVASVDLGVGPNGKRLRKMVVKRYRHRTDGVVTSHVAVLGALVTQ